MTSTLSKSWFKLGLQCPRKLVYAANPSRYPSTLADDEFLQALANGGHAVGELARRQYTGVVLIAARETAAQCAETARYLEQDEVTLAEATFQHENLLVRVDILVKRGSEVRLIEVKSKTLDPDRSFRNKSGIESKWLPYLQDVAFQTHVLRKCHPEWTLRPALMLVNPTVECTADRLGSRIRVEGSGRDLKLIVDPRLRMEELRHPVLYERPVDQEVEEILSGSTKLGGSRALFFSECIQELSVQLASGREPPPVASNHCRKCEFHVPPGQASSDSRSGWAECMQHLLPTVSVCDRSVSAFSLYGDKQSRRGLELLNRGYLALADLPDDVLESLHPAAARKTEGASADPGNIRPADRWRCQVQNLRPGAEARQLEREGIRAAFSDLKFPLHFVDFETARTPLPFHRGQRPNQQLLFQYSHHCLTAEDKLCHASESLVTRPGVNPSILVLRALSSALARDRGSVVHWFPHERNVLNDLKQELESAQEPDRDGLIECIERLTGRAPGAGRLFDLGMMVRHYAVFADTSGSSSIKKVLRSVLAQSEHLKKRYGRPIYGTPEMPSHNFGPGWTWLRMEGGHVADPYTLLDPLYTDPVWHLALEESDDKSEGAIHDGGGAMVAYAELQRDDLPETERRRYEQQLRRYCELDTLAMVMVYEALKEWVTT